MSVVIVTAFPFLFYFVASVVRSTYSAPPPVSQPQQVRFSCYPFGLQRNFSKSKKWSSGHFTAAERCSVGTVKFPVQSKRLEFHNRIVLMDHRVCCNIDWFFDQVCHFFKRRNRWVGTEVKDFRMIRRIFRMETYLVFLSKSNFVNPPGIHKKIINRSHALSVFL